MGDYVEHGLVYKVELFVSLQWLLLPSKIPYTLTDKTAQFLWQGAKFSAFSFLDPSEACRFMYRPILCQLTLRSCIFIWSTHSSLSHSWHLKLAEFDLPISHHTVHRLKGFSQALLTFEHVRYVSSPAVKLSRFLTVPLHLFLHQEPHKV